LSRPHQCPEVAILGVSKSTQKPISERGAFIPAAHAAAVAFLRSSRDRRAEAARFVVFLAQTLGDVKALL